MTTVNITSSRLLFALCLTVVLALSVVGSSIPSSNALTQRDFNYLKDQHLTVSNGDTKVCGDHMCTPGEWTKLQEALAAAQKGHQT
ncbi:MAG: hypothetical protein KGI25_08470 [Thaumarchaeota archaeon]|nr:hypothetical protein [Nitrososphaerota archaeon]